MFHLLAGLVLCCLVCRLLPTFVHRRSPSTTPVAPAPLISLVGLSFHSFLLLPPLPPFPWAPPTADAWRCLLRCASSSCHLAMNRSTSSGTPPCHFPTFFAAVDHSKVSTPDVKGECSADPSVTRNFPTVFGYASMSILKLSARPRVLPASHRAEHYSTGYSLLVLPQWSLLSLRST